MYAAMGLQEFISEGLTVFVPTMLRERLVDDEGFLSPAWQNLFEQLLQNMQQAVSDEGFLIPSLSSSDISVIEANALDGTLVFNTSAVNGGSSSAPNGQLYVKLADGTFHPVTNT